MNDDTIQVLEKARKEWSKYPSCQERAVLLAGHVKQVREEDDPFGFVVNLSHYYDELQNKSEDMTNVGILLNNFVGDRLSCDETGPNCEQLPIHLKRNLHRHRLARMALSDGYDVPRPDPDEIVDKLFGRPTARANSEADLLPSPESIAAQIVSPRELDPTDTEAEQIADALFNRQTPAQREAARTAQSESDDDDWFGKDFRPRNVYRTYTR